MPAAIVRNSPCGSLWHRWDLHFHTPSSFDYEDMSVSNNKIVDRLVAEGVRVVAITNHHVIDVDRIRQLQELGADLLTVLPGIEFRDDHGGKPVHYISIFPEDCDIEHVWRTLEGSLGLTAAGIKEKGGNDKIYIPIEKSADLTRQLHGVISIHAGSKTNSIEEIKNYEQFQERIKYDITKEWVDLMEIGQLKDIDVHLKTIFPGTGLDRPLVICSDNHKVSEYKVKAPLWFRADPTFRGLLMVLREPRDRVFIGDRPPDMVRVEQNRTKYIRGISFQRKPNAPSTELWFTGNILFNHGLIAIVGNKGSGKSALSDTLGLLGGTKNADGFSFLSKKRFRHPGGGFAAFFEATLEWESGDTATKCLADTIEPDEIERLKYLPQDHVEMICNELAGIEEEGFEQEIKAVIFSHVPEAERLGHATLDELVLFQTGEKQRRIDSLIKQLLDVNRSRAALEVQADPAVKRELLERINRRKHELEVHDRAMPTEAPNPDAKTGVPALGATLPQDLTTEESTKEKISEQISKANETLRIAERRHAVAMRLLEKLGNFEKDFEVFKTSLSKDAIELGMTTDELVAISISKTKPAKVRDDAATEITGTKEEINSVEPPGLRMQLAAAEKKIAELQLKLDAPNRLHQAFLKSLEEWKTSRALIEGSDKEPESLKGLLAALAALDQLPAKTEKVKNEQVGISLQIHAEKLAQAEVYRKLYSSVQGFIDSHILAKDKLKLEFRAELSNQDFAGRFLDLLALNRRGSFMGIDEGRARVESLLQSSKWDDTGSVRQFLGKVEQALHTDQRDEQRVEVQLKDQLPKGKKLEEVFGLLYGLEYLRPRYILRWEGKDLSMLSAGERGTLLLVFYLLIDKSDIPLIIDQPEGNLDNQTVAKSLVDCIKEARKRRQVFIVTHNPNLAVVCDADQIIHASMNKIGGNAIVYASGSLENPAMSQFVTDVLEGTRWAFRVRDKKYQVGER